MVAVGGRALGWGEGVPAHLLPSFFFRFVLFCPVTLYRHYRTRPSGLQLVQEKPCCIIQKEPRFI